MLPRSRRISVIIDLSSPMSCDKRAILERIDSMLLKSGTLSLVSRLATALVALKNFAG